MHRSSLIAFTWISLFILAFATISVAEKPDSPPEPPRTPKAKEAIEKHRVAAEKLKQDYYTKLIALDDQLLKDLDGSLKIAAKNAGADEVARITYSSKLAEADLQQHREAVSPPKFWLWEYKGHGKHWLKADRTCVADGGFKGTWERHGNQIIVRFGAITDTLTIAPDGQSFVGISNGGEHLSGTFLGTNLTGAEEPSQ